MSTTLQDAAAANANPSGTIKTSVSINFPILAAGVLLFECIRRHFRRAYDIRRQDEDILNASVSHDKFFRWIPAGFRASDDEILKKCDWTH